MGLYTQLLHTLCFNTQWRYAVFWKLEHGAPMTLNWEDAYYDNSEQCDLSENTAFPVVGNLRDWHSLDPLRLAVAKMSYHVYSLGEGVIGQVAVTEKHMWIFGDKLVIDSCSPFEHSDGWHAQFAAGIRTLVLVSVFPHGVVQLGSLNKIPEDLEMVNHIREYTFALQDSSGGCTTRDIHCTMRSSSCLSDISTRSSASGISNDRLSCLRRPGNKDKKVFQASTFPSIEQPANHFYIVPLPGDLPKKAAEVINKDGVLEKLARRGDESTVLLQSRSELFIFGQQKRWTRFNNSKKCEGETSGTGYQGAGSVQHDAPCSSNSFDTNTIYKKTFPGNDSEVDITYLQADPLGFAACNNPKAMCIPKSFACRNQRDLENMVFQTDCYQMEPVDMPFKFSVGCELYEVLGAVPKKQRSYCGWAEEKTETETAIEMREGIDSSSLLTEDSGSEQLLEAVVANLCCSVTDVKTEKSFCESAKSQLTTEEMPLPTCSKLTVGSAGYSFDQSLVEKEALCLSSKACGVNSSKGFSSRSHGTFSEQFDRAQDLAKIGKKRARPGESFRPRPRDRQLIQDRIKELRELVPNGSKCSIDSLLERTIKHMLFMQTITKHAEKLNKCTKSKLHDKETVIQGSPSYDQGSTWAMEVGGLVKVCPIMVENINKNGQMLIEMLCEECSHFLEIAEAIRSLGLMILKGATEACGRKTLICFVVEGQNNRSMHRTNILWSLVQILQTKTTI